MKFAVGFAVGAFVGRPVIRMLSRRSGLTRMVENVAKHAVYSAADFLAEMDEQDKRLAAEGKPKRDKVWRNR